jgi:hypothetical protein
MDRMYSKMLVVRGLALIILVSCFGAVTAAPATNALSKAELGQGPDVSVSEPSGKNRVTAGAIIYPASAAPGQMVTVKVKLRIAPGHWIYGLDDSGTISVPTTLHLPGQKSAFRPTGPWRGSPPKIKADGSRIYSDEVVFERPFVIERGAKGEKKLPITIQYQVCNERVCQLPATLSVEVALRSPSSP